MDRGRGRGQRHLASCRDARRGIWSAFSRRAVVRRDAAAADGLVGLPGRQRIDAQPELSDHGDRAAGGCGAQSHDRVPGVHRACRRERRRPGPYRRLGGKPGDAECHGQPAGDGDRRRVARRGGEGEHHPPSRPVDRHACGRWQERDRDGGGRGVGAVRRDAARRAWSGQPARARGPRGGWSCGSTRPRSWRWRGPNAAKLSSPADVY